MKISVIKKIKAFTLSEMIVVLVITMIVVGLAFTILNLIQKQMSGIEQNYEHGTEVNLLRQSLWIDFSTYANTNYNPQLSSVSCQNEMGTVNYIIEDNLIIRNTDTLTISIAEKKFYFDGKEVNSGPIDAMHLLTSKAEGAKVIFVYKNNTAETYLK